MNELRYWYNGYRFSENFEDTKVYNPFSVLYCLQKKLFKNYWFESGTPSFLIGMIKNQFESLETIETIELSEASLGTFEIDNIPIITILFQTGYLTIHNYDVNSRKYKLSYPNFEVRESFKKYLISALSNKNVVDIETSLSQIKKALNTNNIDLFCNTFFEKKYYEKYLSRGKKIILTGLTFDYDDKILTLNWVTEELPNA